MAGAALEASAFTRLVDGLPGYATLSAVVVDFARA
jgi:hypothetical protein